MTEWIIFAEDFVDFTENKKTNGLYLKQTKNINKEITEKKEILRVYDNNDVKQFSNQQKKMQIKHTNEQINGSLGSSLA